ncbi:hypothetical protein QBC40DRAFT_278623 [Triangularia verruculosa]|uniref:Uncharacterized protein n=1 Tax=Triangularia verruculosa TaxID=2587418 RepID=A0AAN6XL08_9PEZI|nr:hypothetical protein QBC40DRAFT_278623 [Triangularia verruculosa]
MNRLGASNLLRPVLQQSRGRVAQRCYSNPQGPHVGEKGTTKVYNKDGTNPNKNFVYLGAVTVGLGAVYFMFGGKKKSANSTAAAADRAA